MTTLQNWILQACNACGLQVDFNFEVGIGNGHKIQASACIRDIGDLNGMLLLHNLDDVYPYTNDITQAGYGWCFMNEPGPEEMFDLDSFKELFEDWGWLHQDRTCLVLNPKYYFVMAVIKFTVGDYKQMEPLYLLKIGEDIIGCSIKFDIYTTDIEDVCDDENAHRAEWTEWKKEWDWKWRPATLEEIKAAKLDRWLIGSRKDIKSDSPLELM